MKELREKWVLITGAASGIGKALAHEFAKRGSNIILADINDEGMNKAAAEVEEKGVKTMRIRADVSRPEDVEALARSALDKAGRVDVLVNNAGIAFVSEMEHCTVEEWERIMAINLRGPILLAHHILPHMIERNSGHIVNVASMAGLMGIPGMVAYTATKFGMVGFSEALRIELHAKGIGVTAVCPGIVDTPIVTESPIRGFSEEMRNAPSILVISPDRAARMIVKGVRKNRARVVPATFLTRILLPIVWMAPGIKELILRKAYERFERAKI